MLGYYLFVYVVARDFGFAPNPFNGYCTLATCKPRMRNSASVGDWIMGVGGSRLNATGRCIYLMKITEKITFEEYWNSPRFEIKKACRNGSRLRMVGDNIYHKENDKWIQEDSHHSKPDGSPNQVNIDRDTKSNKVLISSHFYYFGAAAIDVPLKDINFRNGRSHRKIVIDESVRTFIDKIEKNNRANLNIITADPFEFTDAHKRVDQSNNKIM